MSKKTKALLFWSFVPFGILLFGVVRYTGPSWVTILCCLLYGFMTAMAGMVIGIAQTRAEEKEVVRSAMAAARAAEENMLNAISAAQGVVASSSEVVALAVAEKMVNELVSNPQNDEQVMAAHEAAKRIAAEEAEKIKKQVGAKSAQ